MPKYKWEYPGEWLREQIMKADEKRLRTYALLLAGELEPDEIQDIFQEEMAGDGYFEPCDAIGSCVDCISMHGFCSELALAQETEA